MDGLFLGILNLSLYGSFAIVAVLILRFLLKTFHPHRHRTIGSLDAHG